MQSEKKADCYWRDSCRTSGHFRDINYSLHGQFRCPKLRSKVRQFL